MVRENNPLGSKVLSIFKIIKKARKNLKELTKVEEKCAQDNFISVKRELILYDIFIYILVQLAAS